MIGGKCDLINAALSNFKEVVGTDKCFDVETDLQLGVVWLILAIAL